MRCSEIALPVESSKRAWLSVAVRRWCGDPLWRFAAVLIAVWGATSLTAVSLWNPQVMRVFQAFPGTLALLSQGVAVVVAECLLISVVFSAGKTLARANPAALRGAGRLLLGVTGLALFAGLVLIAASWFLRAHRMDFAVPSVVGSVLAAPSSILPLLTRREYLLLGCAAAAALAICVALWMTVPASTPRRLLPMAMICAGLALVPGAVLRLAPDRWMPVSQVAKLCGAVESELLPSVTLFWAPLLGAHGESAPPAVMRLERRYNLNAYASRIQHGVERPNILIFVIESLRADAIRQTVGGRPVMKVVSGLANRGLVFTHARSASNESSLSMSAMIGGVYPLKRPGRSTGAGSQLDAVGLVDVLSPVYRTAFVSSADELWQNMIQISGSPRLDFFFHAGSFHGAVPPLDPLDVDISNLTKSTLSQGTLDDRDTTGALHGWLRKSLEAAPARPFYAMVSYQASHYPYQHGFRVPTPFSPHELDDAARRSLSFLSYPPELTGVMRNRYWNSLAYIDSLIGETIELLRGRDALDNTVVMVVGDHGESFHEGGAITHAGRLTEHSMRIGFVAWGARQWMRGEYTQPLGMVDLAPMVLNLARMPEYGGFQGSVPPGLCLEPAEESAARPRPVFVSVQAMAFEDAVVCGRWKFVMGAFNSSHRLYDLAADPEESRNLARERPEAAGCLEQALRSFRSQQLAYHRDPLMKSRWFPPRHDAAVGAGCASVLDR